MQTPLEKFEILKGCTKKISITIPIKYEIEYKNVLLTLRIVEMAWMFFRNSKKCSDILISVLGKNYPPKTVEINDEDQKIIDIIYPRLEEIFIMFVKNISLTNDETYLLMIQMSNGDEIKIAKTSPDTSESIFTIYDYSSSQNNNCDENSTIDISLCCTLNRFRIISGNYYEEYNDVMVCHKAGWLSGMEALMLQLPS
jgi:hypothetical protein